MIYNKLFQSILKKTRFIFFIVLLFSNAVSAQQTVVPLQDLTDVLREMRKPSKPPKQLKMEVKKIFSPGLALATNIMGATLLT